MPQLPPCPAEGQRNTLSHCLELDSPQAWGPQLTRAAHYSTSFTGGRAACLQASVATGSMQGVEQSRTRTVQIREDGVKIQASQIEEINRDVG